MEDSNKKFSISSGGLGFNGALFITFLVLKLTHVIDWSWWWISAPLWIPLALVLGILTMVFGCVLLCEVLKSGNSNT